MNYRKHDSIVFIAITICKERVNQVKLSLFEVIVIYYNKTR